MSGLTWDLHEIPKDMRHSGMLSQSPWHAGSEKDLAEFIEPVYCPHCWKMVGTNCGCVKARAIRKDWLMTARRWRAMAYTYEDVGVSPSTTAYWREAKILRACAWELRTIAQ